MKGFAGYPEALQNRQLGYMSAEYPAPSGRARLAFGLPII